MANLYESTMDGLKNLEEAVPGSWAEIRGVEDHMFPVKHADETAAVVDDWIKSQGATK